LLPIGKESSANNLMFYLMSNMQNNNKYPLGTVVEFGDQYEIISPNEKNVRFLKNITDKSIEVVSIEELDELYVVVNDFESKIKNLESFLKEEMVSGDDQEKNIYVGKIIDKARNLFKE